MDRRKFILSVGTATTVGLAGCSSLSGSGSVDTSSPTAVIESYYGLSDEFSEDSDVDEIIDTLDPALHSASPYPELIRGASEDSDSDDVSEQEPSEPQEVENVDTEVTDENLDVNGLNEFGLVFVGVTEEELDAIAEENAVVATDVTYADAQDTSPEHVVATEDGDWLIVL